MKFTVGGEVYEFDAADVVRNMRGEQPEMVQKYAVEIGGVPYPPKQVFGKMSGRDRQSFTTMEAQRVLSRLGFEIRGRNHPAGDGRRTISFVPQPEVAHRESPGSRVTSDVLDSELATIKLAIAELSRRVEVLESTR